MALELMVDGDMGEEDDTHIVEVEQRAVRGKRADQQTKHENRL
jgi:hypothetical protein